MNIFDVNKPAPMDAITQYIGGYQTPEAAAADTMDRAPQGYDYLTKSYQELTGDAFSNPFTDASSAHSRALIQAAAGGAGVATGSGGGQIVVAPHPSAPLPNQVDRTVAAANGSSQVATLQPPDPMAAGLNAFDRRSVLPPLQGQPTSPFNTSTVAQRVAAAGVNPNDKLVQSIINDPATTAAYNAPDPTSLRDKTGKIIPAQALHPITSNPNFQLLMRSQPQAAQAVYKAIAGTGRDLGTDMQAHSEFAAGQKAQQDKVIESIKNPYVHPVTGQIYHTADVKDMSGVLTQQEMPLSDLQQAVLDQRGGVKSVFGVDLPNTAGLPRLNGTTNAEHAQYVNLTMQYLKNKARPDAADVQQASQRAHTQLYKANVANNATPSATPKVLDSLNAVGNSAISGINKGVGVTNDLIGAMAALTGHDVNSVIPLLRHTSANANSGDIQALLDNLAGGGQVAIPPAGGMIRTPSGQRSQRDQIADMLLNRSY